MYTAQIFLPHNVNMKASRKLSFVSSLALDPPHSLVFAWHASNGKNITNLHAVQVARQTLEPAKPIAQGQAWPRGDETNAPLLAGNLARPQSLPKHATT